MTEIEKSPEHAQSGDQRQADISNLSLMLSENDSGFSDAIKDQFLKYTDGGSKTGLQDFKSFVDDLKKENAKQLSSNPDLPGLSVENRGENSLSISVSEPGKLWGNTWRNNKELLNIRIGEGAQNISVRGGSPQLISHAKISAGDGSVVTAAESTSVSAENGSFVVAEKGSYVFANDGSFVAGRKGSILQAEKGSRVTTDSGIVYAYDGSNVGAYKGGQVYAKGLARVYSNNSFVYAENGAQVGAGKNSKVDARSGSSILAMKDSEVVAGRGAQVEAMLGSFVIGHEGSRIHARGGSLVRAESGSQVVAERGAHIIFSEGAKVKAQEGAELESIQTARDCLTNLPSILFPNREGDKYGLDNKGRVNEYIYGDGEKAHFSDVVHDESDQVISFKDSMGNSWSRQDVSTSENLMVSLRKEIREKHPELLELLSQKQIPLWKMSRADGTTASYPDHSPALKEFSYLMGNIKLDSTGISFSHEGYGSKETQRRLQAMSHETFGIPRDR